LEHLPMSIRICLAWLTVLIMVTASHASLTGADEARALFKNPTRHYSNGPLWVWNDLLTDKQIRESLRELARQDVKQVWVHPRPGLMTPYLSSEWFRLWRLALREAEKLDMNVWIYDENSYPSGFAGGFVPDAMPESRGRGLAFRESKTQPTWDTNIVGVYRLDGGSRENVTSRIKAGEQLSGTNYLVAHLRWAENRAWHGGRFYVNLLSPGVTEKFMEVTYGPYKKELGQHFGKRIPGIFTDEPNIRPVHGTLPWSEIIAEEFQKRWGYDLLDHLPSLHRKVGDFRKVRHNYFQVLHEQFVELWARPNYEYCAENNLEWTGHYWDHDWPDCIGVPDNMAMYAWHQRPAIDCLMNQYREATDAQFGNVRMVRELSSVANQLGIKRTLCETYGAAGWDLRFEDMKRIGDWLQVLGVNTINEHLTFVTIRGARKRDHPQSFSYHAPWWEAYHVPARYFARLSAALSQGEQINTVAVLQPTTTAWMYQDDHGRLNEIGNTFFDLVMALEAAQVEYDLVSEDILVRHGRPGDEKIQLAGNGTRSVSLCIGQRDYSTLVIPPFTENLNRKTQELLDQVSIETILPGSMPSRIDGVLTGAEPNFDWIRANAKDWIANTVDRLRDLQKTAPVFIERNPGDRGILFHMRRQLADGQLLFLVNTSIEHPSHAVIHSELTGMEEWDLHTGKVKPYPAVAQSGRASARVELPPSGSLLLLLNNGPAAGESSAELVRVIAPASEMTTKRLAENVLTLDYMDVTVGGESLTNVYFQPAAQLVWKKHGMDRNPWDSAVQFKDELITRKFPAGSGFEATYKFMMKDLGKDTPRRLSAVIERPDLYSITFNGRKVKPNGKWWLDKSFGRIDIAKLVQPGENRLTIKASPFTIMHELEPAYIVGDFALEFAPSGFVIVEDKPITFGRVAPDQSHSINPDGTMWLSAGVDFKQGLEDRAPWLIFDLGDSADVAALKIWNYNEAHVRDLASRGARSIRVTAGDTDKAQPKLVGEFQLDRGNNHGLAQVVSVEPLRARYIRFDFLSNHGGVVYPFKGKGGEKENDHAMVGLAEVRFLDRQGNALEGTRVASFSSELSSHGRLARTLIDDSGLDDGRRGWNLQGHPFYGDAVAYTQSFDLPTSAGRYLLNLPSWHGSVARVTVNGKLAGWITAPPFECDVTKHLKRGSNRIEVAVVGTLKNTLGPHHGNPALGTAWPSKFRSAPELPPPGSQYSTVAYGLFDPMVLKNLVSP
jgi:hypothetical protein